MREETSDASRPPDHELDLSRRAAQELGVLPEVSRYTAAANQLLLADQALEALGGPKRERKIG